MYNEVALFSRNVLYGAILCGMCMHGIPSSMCFSAAYAAETNRSSSGIKMSRICAFVLEWRAQWMNRRQPYCVHAITTI